MKTLFILLAVATVACMVSARKANDFEKRVFLNTIIEWFKNTYNKAKETFEKLTSGLNFDALVDLLIPYIHSGMTVSACVSVCIGAASAVLGPLGITSAALCTPLCEGALAKLEQVAG